MAETLLTRQIDADGNNYNSYANRSFVMARQREWDHALDDAVKVRDARKSCSPRVELTFTAIVHQHSTLLDGVYFQRHCPLWKDGLWGSDRGI
jgi:hypothetical protein